eukprot:SAG25_NODE_354_length_9250_cov_2.824281_9_plen_296_part_00
MPQARRPNPREEERTHLKRRRRRGRLDETRRGGGRGAELARTRLLPGHFHTQFRDENRRDIGQSQSKWTASKMETPGSLAAAPATVIASGGRAIAITTTLPLPLPPPRPRRGVAAGTALVARWARPPLVQRRGGDVAQAGREPRPQRRRLWPAAELPTLALVTQEGAPLLPAQGLSTSSWQLALPRPLVHPFHPPLVHLFHEPPIMDPHAQRPCTQRRLWWSSALVRARVLIPAGRSRRRRRGPRGRRAAAPWRPTPPLPGPAAPSRAAARACPPPAAPAPTPPAAAPPARRRRH